MLDRALGPPPEPPAAAGAHPQGGSSADGDNAAVAGKAEDVRATTHVADATAVKRELNANPTAVLPTAVGGHTPPTGVTAGTQKRPPDGALAVQRPMQRIKQEGY